MTKAQAYHGFWNSFGIPAFDQYSVPEEIDGVKVVPPYITYAYSEDNLGYPVSLTASIWYRETTGTWANVTQKAEEISEYIGRGGHMVSYDQGAFWITKGTPWMQRMDDPDDEFIRRIVLQFNVNYLD